MILDSEQEVMLKVLRRLRAIEACLEGKVLVEGGKRFQVDEAQRIRATFVNVGKQEMVEEEF